MGWSFAMGWGMGFQAALGYMIGQPEIFAKSATNGASAARRHFADQQNPVEYPFGDEPSPLHFRFQAASGVRQPAERSGVAKLKRVGVARLFFKARTVGLLGVGMAAQRHENGLCSVWWGSLKNAA